MLSNSGSIAHCIRRVENSKPYASIHKDAHESGHLLINGLGLR
jgi:hypothetical protein